LSVTDRLKELGIQLQPPPPPVANYIRAKQWGNILFIAGQRPQPDARGNRPLGKVGTDLSLEEAYQVARELGIRLLGAANESLGSLERVRSILKVTGLINSAPGFIDTAKVLNGCSDMLCEVFGDEIGKHTRIAYTVDLGMAPMEIDMILGFE